MATGKMTIDFWTHCETDLGKHSIYYLIPYFPTVIGLGWEGAGIGGVWQCSKSLGFSVNSDPVSLYSN